MLVASPQGIWSQTWQWIGSNIHTVGWTFISGFILWAWRKSVRGAVVFNQHSQEWESAIKQLGEIHSAATNHMPTALESLVKRTEDTNAQLTEQTKTLSSIDKGIAVLVDRR